MTHHIVIATPMHGGLCQGAHATSVMGVRDYLRAAGHKCSIITQTNESLISRGRNTMAAIFLSNPDTTHLLFIDADQTARPSDVRRMIEADKDIICAPVPMKVIDWEAIAAAVKRGVPANQLERHGGVFNIQAFALQTAIDPREPFRIKRGGAGMMLVQRGVFTALAPKVESYIHNLPGDVLPRGITVKNFFPTPIVDGELLSEDFGLCHLWTQAGGTIWCAPWCEVQHMGTYKFSGVFREKMEAASK